MAENSKEVICCLCKKPIPLGKVYYQAGQKTHPIHKECRIEIKPSKRYGGGI